MASSGKKYSNHLATLRYWLRRDQESVDKLKKQKETLPYNPARDGYTQREYDDEFWEKFSKDCEERLQKAGI